MDSVCLFHLNGALLNNNAVACYNGMIPELTSVHLQSLGLPPNASKYSVKLNQDTQHHIKPTTGIANTYYSYSTEHPKYGKGQ
eukprot:3244402-Ditylum_brightwellii.AAC.1